RSSLAVAAAVVRPFRQVDLLGRLQPLELGERTVQPDLAARRVGQLDGHEPPLRVMVPGLDDQMSDRPGGRVEDGAAYLATETIRAADLGPHRELRHRRLPFQWCLT